MTQFRPMRSSTGAGASWVLAVILTLSVSCAPGIRVAPPTQIQAWVAYFDADRGMAEVNEHGALFDRISLFAYELGSDGTPQPAPRMARMIPRFLGLAERHGFSPWVTVVNDVRFERDSAVLKDSVLVHEILSNPARRRAHATALAEIVSRDGFSGLHLDYEQVAESDSSAFGTFVRELRRELDGRSLGLEVVVEPSRGPLPSASTANVSVMAYDLFGPHSGPGPRATPEFVSGLFERVNVDADSAGGLAMALGGFAWEPSGDVRLIDWAVGPLLAAEARISQRNPADGVLSATLDDGTEVWFEDRESLLRKWDSAWRSGFRRLLLWRLGGNDEQLFEFLADLKSGAARR